MTPHMTSCFRCQMKVTISILNIIFYHLNWKLKIEKNVHDKFPISEKQHIFPLTKALTVNVWHPCLINDLNKWSSKCSALAFSMKSSYQHWPIPAIIPGKDVEISWRHTARVLGHTMKFCESRWYWSLMLSCTQKRAMTSELSDTRM